MARSPNRRPGYSRRAQYGLFFGYVTAVSGAIIALLLLILSTIDPDGFGALKGAVDRGAAHAEQLGQLAHGVLVGSM